MKKLVMKVLRFLRLDGLLLGLVEKLRLGLSKKLTKGAAALDVLLD